MITIDVAVLELEHRLPFLPEVGKVLGAFADTVSAQTLARFPSSRIAGPLA